MRHTYHYSDLSYKSLGYSFLALSTDLADPDDLSLAFDVFQRLALAVEIIRLDVTHHGDSTVRTSFLWRKVELHLTEILEVLKFTLAGKGNVLTKVALPSHFVCIRHSVKR